MRRWKVARSSWQLIGITVAIVVVETLTLGRIPEANTDKAGAQEASSARLTGEARVQFMRLVSALTPFSDNCGDVGGGTGIPGAEVEVHLAIDPSNLDHLVATWQQDRYTSNGAARSNLVASSWDGGHSWLPPSRISNVSSCTGTTDPPRTRATDPSVAIGADGAAYQASQPTWILADPLTGANKDVDLDVAVATSRDGGRSWPSPKKVAQDDGKFWHEKPVVAADPVTPGRAYAAWLRHLTPDPLDVQGTLDVDMAFARTEDGGTTWSWSDGAPSIVPPDVEGRVEAVMDMVTVRRPQGGVSIVVGFAVMSDRLTATTADMFTTHSEDGGKTWSTPGRVAGKTWIRTVDSEKVTQDGPREIEGGEANVPSLAVAPDGTLYAVWQQHTPAGNNVNGGAIINVARSQDLGDTWSTIEKMNLPSPVLLPEIAVAGDGTVGVAFYDLRNDVLADTPLTTDLWLRYSQDRGENWKEVRLAESFDMRTAPVDSGGGRYMLGDYGGMVGFPRGFGVLAAVAEPLAKKDPNCCPNGVHGQSDVFFIRVKVP